MMATSIRARLSAVGLRRIASSSVVVAFLGLFVLTGGWRMLADAVAGWFEPAVGLHDEFEPAHRIHVLTFSVLVWPAVIGMIAQLWAPRKHVGGQLMAMLPWLGLVLAFALTGFWKGLPMIAIMGSLVGLAAILHPSGRALLTWVMDGRTNRVMLALVLVAAVPLLSFSGTQVGLQNGAIEPAHDHAGGTDHEQIHQEHVDAGHFGLMAAFGFVVIGMGLLASLRPVGRWLPAWCTGVLAAFVGLASVLFPQAASSADMVWGLAAIAWGIAFVGTSELDRAETTPSPYGEWDGAPTTDD